MRSTFMLLLLLVGCAPCVATPEPQSPCEAVRPAYNDALTRINSSGSNDCTDGFEAFGCGWFDAPSSAQVEHCEETLGLAQSCAALQNALYECEGGT